MCCNKPGDTTNIILFFITYFHWLHVLVPNDHIMKIYVVKVCIEKLVIFSFFLHIVSEVTKKFQLFLKV